ncbi:MAG: T9SS type A sorting domain-containing protein [Sphingomonadales bacterium]|nr:T9SS type A sorting domain-containing protein [Sphingomonadales bacterium]
MTGAEVNRQIFSAQDNNDWMELRDIPQGFYTLTVSSSENRWVRKVMVK